MGSVTEIRPKQLEKLAEDFVDLWESTGKEAAAIYIRGKYEDSESDRLSHLIKVEFMARGWTFPEMTDAEIKASEALKNRRNPNEAS